MFPINRVVAVLTPVFSAVAAVGSAWLLKHFPGAPVPSASELLGVEVTVATSAGAAALKWLHGHQAYEKRLAEAESTVKHVVTTIDAADPKFVGQIEAQVKAEVAKALSEVKLFAPAAAPTGVIAGTTSS